MGILEMSVASLGASSDSIEAIGMIAWVRQRLQS